MPGRLPFGQVPPLAGPGEGGDEQPKDEHPKVVYRLYDQDGDDPLEGYEPYDAGPRPEDLGPEALLGGPPGAGADEAGLDGFVYEDAVAPGFEDAVAPGYEEVVPPGYADDAGTEYDDGGEVEVEVDYDDGAGPVAYDLYDQALPTWAPRPRHRRRRRILAGFGIFLVLVLIAGLVAFVRVSHDINPGGKLGAAVTVDVPKGASTPTVAQLLAGAGVVHSGDVFEIYLKLESTGPLLAGTYHLRTNEPYSMAMAALEKGPAPVVRDLVVPEGFTVAEMAAAVGRLKGIGISRAAFIAAARNGQVSSIYLPAGKANLEGLLFPATYPVAPSETADVLVQYMAETFSQRAIQLGLAAAAHKLGYSPYQVVTVASIVEREAKFEIDRGPIASVIYNRLARGMPIGAQSTLDYAVGIKKGEANDVLPNRYNTLLHTGLPPTPIGSPGLLSLKAAMHPPHTTYLYWVEVNPDGKMAYASTDAGFRHLQQECRQAKLC